jgi:glycosyltransferase involved in cell wall biosynthesis
MRAVIVSLSTYSSPYNDGKLQHIGASVDDLVVLTGQVHTKWGLVSTNRSGDRYDVRSLPPRFARRRATVMLRGGGQLIAAAHPDVIHVEAEPWQAVAVQGMLASIRLGVPFGVHFAENGPQLSGTHGLGRRRVAARVLRSAAYAIGWSDGSTEVAHMLAPGVPRRTFPAVGVPDFLLDRRDARDRPPPTVGYPPPTIAFIGRLEPEKGVHEFISICDAISRSLPIRAIVIGSGTLQDDVDRWTALHSWATALGALSRERTFDSIASADAVVVPSRTTRRVVEQFGLVAAESMAIGTPTFVYACGGLPSVVGDGAVVRPEGDVDGMAKAIIAHFRNPGVDDQLMRVRARERARCFVDSHLAQQLLQTWDETLHLRRSGPRHSADPFGNPSHSKSSPSESAG